MIPEIRKLEMLDEAIVILHTSIQHLQLMKCVPDAVPNGEEHVLLGPAEALHLLQDSYHLSYCAPVPFDEPVQSMTVLSSLGFLKHNILRVLYHF